jgi:type IV pilus assembly protein PilB
MPNLSWLTKIVANNSADGSAPPKMPDSIVEAWQIAAQHTDMDQAHFAEAVATAFGLATCSFDTAKDVVGRYIPYKLAKEKLIVPIRLEDAELVIASANPADEDASRQARFTSGKGIRVEVASPVNIETHITRLYISDVSASLKNHIRLTDKGEPVSDSEMQHHSIVKLARQILFKAHTLKSSDIHVQPHLGGGQVRFRVDGVLRRSAAMPTNVMERLVRYFMNMTGMDPSQAMVPQDGRATLFVGNSQIDLRVSVLPNRDGHRLVIRLLDQSSVFSLASMNLPPQELKILKRLTSFSQGMILFTGPTGSGKTTSLYGLLSSLNNEQTNIITLENPVEYQIPGLSQVDIDVARGLSFGAGLRSILRQDPDVLLVGEIRDEETAQIATRAALTGHLLFSTLHTMDARNAVSRLLDLDISQPVLGETLLGIIAQRLVRKLCNACSAPTKEPLSDAESLFARIHGRPPAKRAVGCEDCAYTGYKGRAPVLEIIEITPDVRNMLMNNEFSMQGLNERLPGSFFTLGQRARGLIQAGETTVNEAHRVLGLKFWADIAQDENKDIYEFLSGELGDDGVSRANLMLITEDQGLGKGIEDALADEYKVVDFATIDDAVGHLRAKRDTDLLILDMEHAGASPREFLLDLRSAFDWSGLPAVIILPEGDNSINEFLEAHGANYVIHKPVTAEALNAQITAVFQR